ncbi:MAG: N-acetylglucosamine kinase [Bacteroidetes bacterium]|nr:N-acetylglucosamine kinase [Bacteroidota bacterium]
MLLIADSGSTKTTWTLLEDQVEKTTVQTPGLNPYFTSSETVEAILLADLVPNIPVDFVREIHFYGAGCSTENNNSMLREAMQLYFRKAVVSVYHDILGAARALLGSEEGIACILGTGCNACYYDGEEVYSRVPSLGYLFGDEGAGSNLGKTLMEKYLKNRLPSDIRKEFDEEYNFSLEDILNALYNRPFPNRFLASFSEFIAPRQSHPFFHEMVKNSFSAFFEEQVSKYPGHEKLPIGFVGSIAWHYREILLETAAEYKLNVATILKSPMEGLIRFHLNEE